MQGTRKGYRGPCRTTAASLGQLLRCGLGRAAQPGQETVTEADSQPLRTCSPGPGVDTVLPGPGHVAGGNGPASPRTAVSSALTTQLVYIPSAGETLFRAETLKRQRSGTNAGSEDLCVHTRTHTTPPHNDSSAPTQQYTNDTILDQSLLESQKSEATGCVQTRFVLLIVFSLHLM